MNNLIIDNIWRILETWTGGVSNDEMDCSRDVTAPTTALSGIVKADENSWTSGKSTCCCQTSRDETVSRNLPRVEVTEDKEARENAEQISGEEGREICSRCGKLTQGRLAESQIVVCIQLLGMFVVRLVDDLKVSRRVYIRIETGPILFKVSVPPH